jgi:hypothetical protein
MSESRLEGYLHATPCGLAPSWLSLSNGDLGSTQILTRHCGAMFWIISQLMNMGTTPTRQVPIVQPLWVIYTPKDAVSVHAAPYSNIPNATVGLH